MTGIDEPTAEGMRRYPETKGYLTELREPIPCTCKEACQRLCAGECGCEACRVMFAMFCDEAGCFPETAADREQVIRRYRGDPLADGRP